MKLKDIVEKCEKDYDELMRKVMVTGQTYAEIDPAAPPSEIQVMMKRDVLNEVKREGLKAAELLKDCEVTFGARASRSAEFKKQLEGMGEEEVRETSKRVTTRKATKRTARKKTAARHRGSK